MKAEPGKTGKERMIKMRVFLTKQGKVVLCWPERSCVKGQTRDKNMVIETKTKRPALSEEHGISDRLILRGVGWSWGITNLPW